MGPPRTPGALNAAEQLLRSASLARSPQTAPVTRLVPAAQYLRASTGLQTWSIENQRTAIAAYAQARGFEVVATYSDEERSGLTLQGRPALRALLAQALGPSPGFEAILVFDVSRWGRFQDPDEGAHLEFLCRRAGLQVCYCAEPFENDGSPEADLIKQIKRAIAAEFSRDLSRRITFARRQAAQRGWHVSGRAPFGYRREVLNAKGRPVAVLEAGQVKVASDHHLRLILGPRPEVEAVQRAFRSYVITGLKPLAIAEQLAGQVPPPSGAKAWNAGLVRAILRRELYAGALVYGRTVKVLTDRPRRAPPEDVIRLDGAWPQIVSPERFARAQTLLGASARQSDDALLADLRQLLEDWGRVDIGILDTTPGVRTSRIYARRFGSLKAALARLDSLDAPDGR